MTRKEDRRDLKWVRNELEMSLKSKEIDALDVFLDMFRCSLKVISAWEEWLEQDVSRHWEPMVLKPSECTRLPEWHDDPEHSAEMEV